MGLVGLVCLTSDIGPELRRKGGRNPGAYSRVRNSIGDWYLLESQDEQTGGSSVVFHLMLQQLAGKLTTCCNRSIGTFEKPLADHPEEEVGPMTLHGLNGARKRSNLIGDKAPRCTKVDPDGRCRGLSPLEYHSSGETSFGESCGPFNNASSFILDVCWKRPGLLREILRYFPCLKYLFNRSYSKVDVLLILHKYSSPHAILGLW